MDIRKIRKLIELINETGVAEIEVTSGEESVRISRSVAPSPSQQFITAAPAYAAAPQVLAPEAAAPVSVAPAAPPAPAAPEGHALVSPMVGTAFLATAPGEKPFVEIGSRVQAGDTLCLIEAMKMFNKIVADVSGTISARMVENGQPVEYDQVLFIIDPSE